MTAQQASPLPTSWTVTGQTETGGLFNGSFVDGYKVTFVTGAGNNGSVFVPHANYNASFVTGAIAAKAATIDAVSALSSGS